MAELRLTVNDVYYQVAYDPDDMLVDVLRDRLGLTGTKVGCGEGICGSCTVLLNGEKVLSCKLPAERAQDGEVLTIEGLNAASVGGKRDELHPLQKAFVEHGAIQCGFCTPGQIMTAYEFLQQEPDPTPEQIRRAMRGALCRCGGYPSIESAILAAAQAMRTGEEIPPVDLIEVQNEDVIGKFEIRPDAVAKATGEAIYSDDLNFEGMLHGRVKRAGVPHAILRVLDVEAARQLPGVVALLTAEDIPGKKRHGLFVDDWPILVGVGERVRYMGDALALVAAESREIATEAIDLIRAEFDPRPIVSNPVQARDSDAPVLHQRGNLLKHIKIRHGDLESGFESADVVLEDVYFTPTMDHVFMEPECSVACPTDDGRMEVYVGSQIPYEDRRQVAEALGRPRERVRIVGQLMGGGFGGKEDIAGQIHAALLADATDSPVKVLFDRGESMLVHPKRHATQITVKMGAKRDGTITAIKTELYGDTGAYASLGGKVMSRAIAHSSGPYEVANMHGDCYAMYTNNPPAGAFRGFGALQSQFAIERMIDQMAAKLGLDPVDLRRKNALRVGSTTNTGQQLEESVGLIECIDKVDAEMRCLARDDGYETPFEPLADPDAPHLVRAWGIASAYKNTGLGGGALDKAGAELELFADGTLEVRSASAELGQGLVTILRMIVAEELMLSPDRVKVLVMDTDLSPDGGPTTASRQTFVTGNAALHAAKKMRQILTDFLSNRYDCSPKAVVFKRDSVQVDQIELSFERVAEMYCANGSVTRIMYDYIAPTTKPLGEGGDMHFAFSFATQAAEVEVDTRTGRTRVLRVIAANDVGRALNPLGLQGQFEGGVMMGIGHALMENFVVENGEIQTDRFARYKIPRIHHSPEIIPIVVEHPVSAGPYGAKGVGEIVSIPTIPAILNAIENAVGVRINRLPADAKVLREKLEESEKKEGKRSGGMSF
jgi:xanthine dehydrogenase molybdenum-binding subunit